MIRCCYTKMQRQGASAIQILIEIDVLMFSSKHWSTLSNGITRCKYSEIANAILTPMLRRKVEGTTTNV